MGIGPDPHLPPQGLDERTYASAFRSAWRLERRLEGGGWTTVGVYRDSRSAGAALDLAAGAGAGAGDLDDYRIVRARGVVEPGPRRRPSPSSSWPCSRC